MGGTGTGRGRAGSEGCGDVAIDVFATDAIDPDPELGGLDPERDELRVGVCGAANIDGESGDGKLPDRVLLVLLPRRRLLNLGGSVCEPFGDG